MNHPQSGIDTPPLLISENGTRPFPKNEMSRPLIGKRDMTIFSYFRLVFDLRVSDIEPSVDVLRRVDDLRVCINHFAVAIRARPPLRHRRMRTTLGWSFWQSSQHQRRTVDIAVACTACHLASACIVPHRSKIGIAVLEISVTIG